MCRKISTKERWVIKNNFLSNINLQFLQCVSFTSYLISRTNLCVIFTFFIVNYLKKVLKTRVQSWERLFSRLKSLQTLIVVFFNYTTKTKVKRSTLFLPLLIPTYTGRITSISVLSSTVFYVGSRRENKKGVVSEVHSRVRWVSHRARDPEVRMNTKEGHSVHSFITLNRNLWFVVLIFSI